MRLRFGVVCVVGLVGIIAFATWASGPIPGPPEQADRGDVRPVAPEERAVVVHETGEGEMRFAPGPATDDASSSTGSNGAIDRDSVLSRGPLSAASLKALTDSLARQIDRHHSSLAESRVVGSRPTKDQKSLVDMATKMAVLERVVAGDYWTLAPEAETPPIPAGCGSMQIDPHRLPNGDVVKVVVIFDATKVTRLQAMIQSLNSAKEADREQRLREWNAQPDEVRSEAIQRHVQLRIQAGDNPRVHLSSGEFADYWRMELLLDALGADVVPGRTVLFPR